MVVVLELSTTSSGVGNDQIKVVLGKGLSVGFCQFSCSDAISAVNMQCPTATLLFRNNDVVADGTQQTHSRFVHRSLGDIHYTSGEEPYPT